MSASHKRRRQLIVVAALATLLGGAVAATATIDLSAERKAADDEARQASFTVADDAGGMTQAELAAFAGFAVWWPGPEPIDGYPLWAITRGYGPSGENFVSIDYGSCTTPKDGESHGCYPPIAVLIQPACRVPLQAIENSPVLRRTFEFRGTKVYVLGDGAEESMILALDDVLVHVYANGHAVDGSEILDRLVPVNALARADAAEVTDALPPPSKDSVAGTVRCRPFAKSDAWLPQIL
jgi:hypothetical protein